MYKLYFDTEESAKEFIEEINNLGYEWQPVTLTQECALKFEASKKESEKIEKHYFGN